VEVILPSNTDAEMNENRALYFEQGTTEVWFVAESGSVEFFSENTEADGVASSDLCPEFPGTV
jgi:Uma2 family endonuclease